MEERLIEFIKECEHNIKVNEEKGFENRIDLDYVLDRLKDVQIGESYYSKGIREEIDFVIENEVNFDETLNYLLDYTEEDLDNIKNEVIDDDELNAVMYDTIKYYLTHYKRQETDAYNICGFDKEKELEKLYED